MKQSRRSFLGLVGSAAVGGVAGCLGDGSDYENGWNQGDSDTDDTLNDVAALENDAMAVGDDGTVTKRLSEGEWSVQSHAPGARGETNVYGIAPTTNFERAWFAGDGGLVGMYDSHGHFENHSNPLGRTKRFIDVAVDGASGGEDIYLIDDEGAIVRGSKSQQGEVTWDLGKEPGESQALAITFTADNFGYSCTNAGGAYQRVGQGWNRVGVPNVQEGLTDVTGHEQSLLDVASSKGQIHRYNGYEWRKIELGEEPIDAIHRTGRRGLAVSSDGVVYALNRKWERSLDGLPEGLNGATTGTEDSDVVCVGDNGFLIYRSK